MHKSVSGIIKALGTGVITGASDDFQMWKVGSHLEWWSFLEL